MGAVARQERLFALTHHYDWFYDSPPKKQQFSLTNVSWLLDTKKGAIQETSPYIFLFAKRDGLKQSGRQWAGILVETVVEYGMEQCRTDPCVFRMVVGGKVKLIIMAVHVDDTVIAGSDEACRNFHAALNNKFPTNNLVAS